MTDDALTALQLWAEIQHAARRVRDAARFGDELELTRALEDRDFYVSQLQRALR